jgi:hypothetical protein
VDLRGLYYSGKNMSKNFELCHYFGKGYMLKNFEWRYYSGKSHIPKNSELVGLNQALL